MAYKLNLKLKTRFARPSNYGGVRALSKIKYIVIHYTANKGDTDEGNGSYFSREYTGTSAHYFVDEDSATQAVPDNRVGYHCETPGMKFKCACRNYNSIGIEMCSDFNKAKGVYVITEQTKLNAVELTKWIMDKYKIPAERVIRHYDVCGKRCPEPWVRVPSEWNDFKRRLTVKTPIETPVKEVDDEVVSETYIKINGKDIKINRILKDGKNYIDLRGLEAAGFKVGFEPNSKLPTLENDFKEQKVKYGNTDATIEALNVKDHLVVPVRSLCKVLDKDVDFKDKTLIIKD